MSYRKVLLAINLTEEGEILIKKCVELMKSLNAELVIFHDEADYEEMSRGTGFIDIESHEGHTPAIANVAEQFKEMTADIGYPVKRRLIGTGEYKEELKSVIRENEIDLLVCGHHQGFWRSISSSTGQLINHLDIPVLVIPLKS